MEIARIEFPELLCGALRKDDLVIFAGAGVSMGEPAWLPDFKNLATAIAQGTGETQQDDESEDRFLGRLHHKEVQVHSIAAENLQTNLRGEIPKPTDLHRDLLRLYPGPGTTRLVTTNFDLLFESVTTETFGSKPEMFRAPALPLGRTFNGIVHIHGALDRPGGMVLTDADFGRAYLTEGWARRFLVELFRQFTVLFVGYGHNDTVMNYLARALPESDVAKRFALTGESSHDLQHWRVLGIEPIIYPQSSKCDHSKLHEGIHRLAEVFGRGVLDWKREIVDLAGKKPPLGAGEEADLISEVLKDETKTRFFKEIASLPEWIGWLDKSKHLDALFGSGTLSPPDEVLAWWLTERFAHQHANELFLLIARHDTRLHPDFWGRLGRKLFAPDADLLDRDSLSRWVSLLFATAPVDADEFVLESMGKRCAKNGLVDNLLQVFNAMAGSRLLLKPSFERSDDGSGDQGRSVEVTLPLVGGHYELLNSLWEDSLSPNLAQVAEPLLEIVTRRLREQHLTLCVWQQATQESDNTSFGRAAIESHKQDEYPEAVDVLVDAARDCLEWLAENQTSTATRWCDHLVNSETPLLRRLAVHTLSARTELAPDQKIDWLLKHIDLHDLPAHHEIFWAVKRAYPEASPKRRAALIKSILAYRWPDEKFPDKEQLTAYSHFNWLHWLRSVDIDCTLAKGALEEVLSKHPDFEPREHPDFTHWVGNGPDWVLPESPWTPAQLLERPAQDWLSELLSFQPKPTDILGPSRVGIKLAVQEAAEQDFDWGIDLADVLAREEEWDVDLWSGLIRAWSKMGLDEDSHRRVLKRLDRVELYPKHAREIAGVLCMLVKDQGTSHALKFLPQANKIAAALWDCLDRDEPPEKPDDWLTMAINHTAGVLAEFWLGSLATWRRQQEPLPKALGGEYSMALSRIVQDDTLAGKLGRSFLASQFAFLVAVDEAWTKENLLPFFDVSSGAENFQAAWDGFLTWGRLNPVVAEHLGNAFLKAVQRIDKELAGRRGDFVKRYTTILGFFAADPLEWVPELFGNESGEVRRLFAAQVQFHLRNMEEVQQQKWWCRWLKHYWENRLKGVPAPLESGEVERMLGWLPDLTAVFPEAVTLTIRMLDPLPTEAQMFGHGLINRLGRSDSLVQSHPKEVARLLIRLGKFNSPPHPFWSGGKELIDRLLKSDLSLELEQGLKALKAKLGL